MIKIGQADQMEIGTLIRFHKVEIDYLSGGEKMSMMIVHGSHKSIEGKYVVGARPLCSESLRCKFCDDLKRKMQAKRSIVSEVDQKASYH